jgi:uncharacterized protein YbaR (Trm112 family)
MKVKLVEFICPKCKTKIVEAISTSAVFCPECKCWFIYSGEILCEHKQSKKRG